MSKGLFLQTSLNQTEGLTYELTHSSVSLNLHVGLNQVQVERRQLLG